MTLSFAILWEKNAFYTFVFSYYEKMYFHDTNKKRFLIHKVQIFMGIYAKRVLLSINKSACDIGNDCKISRKHFLLFEFSFRGKNWNFIFIFGNIFSASISSLVFQGQRSYVCSIIFLIIG